MIKNHDLLLLTLEANKNENIEAQIFIEEGDEEDVEKEEDDDEEEEVNYEFGEARNDAE